MDKHNEHPGTANRPPTPGPSVTHKSASHSVIRSEERLTATTESVATGIARLQKFVVTETRTITVALSREEVRVVYDTAPTPPTPTGANDDLRGESAGPVVLFAEQPVITTRWVPIETARLEVVVVTNDETISDTVRVERVDTEIGHGHRTTHEQK